MKTQKVKSSIPLSDEPPTSAVNPRPAAPKLAITPPKMPPPRPAVVPIVAGSEAAPFIYTDGAVAYGVNSGIIQIETGSNVLVPTPDGVTKTRVIITAHLRGSIAAMLQIRDAINEAIRMTQPKDDRRSN